MRQSINKKTQEQLGEFWHLSRLTLSKYAAKGCNFDGTDAEVAAWLHKHMSRKPLLTRQAIERHLVKPKKKAKRGGKSKTAEDLRDDYFAELQESKRGGDLEREKLSLTAYLKIDKQIRETALDEKKLGIDKGEMLAREDVERILKNMFWAGNALCHKFSQQLAQRLSNKEPAEIYEMLAPTLTALTIFEGMKRLSKTPGEINLPDWVVDCAKTEQQNYIEYK